MINFLDIGINKIEVRMIFGFVDVERKGWVTVN